MDRRLTFPQFQKAPSAYEANYFNNMVNMLNVLMIALRNPGEGRQSKMVVTGLQSNDYGLEAGTMFAVNGVLRVPLPYSPYVAGVRATTNVGNVSVTVV